MIKFDEYVWVDQDNGQYSGKLSLERIYQAFKERLLNEVRVSSGEMGVDDAQLIDYEPVRAALNELIPPKMSESNPDIVITPKSHFTNPLASTVAALENMVVKKNVEYKILEGRYAELEKINQCYKEEFDHRRSQFDQVQKELEKLKTERDTNEDRLKGLRDLCGYLANGSERGVKIFQEDTHNVWVINVDETNILGTSFIEVIDNAIRELGVKKCK